MPPRRAITALTALVAFGAAAAEGGFSLTLIAATTVVLWWGILLCLALRVLPRDPLPGAALVLAGAALALAAWTGLSLIWATDVGAAFAELVRTFLYLGLLVLVLLTSSRREGARPWLAGLAIGLSAVVVLALSSRFDPTIDADGFLRDRLSYPIGYWNGLAACAAVAATLLGWFSANAVGRLGRVAATAALPLPVLAIVLSSSRGGAAAAGLGAIVLVGLGPRRLQLLAGMFLAAVGSAALILIANSQQALSDGLTDSAAYSQGRWLLAATIVAVALAGLVRWFGDSLIGGLRLSRREGRVAVAAVGVVAAVVLIAADPPARYDEFKQPPRGAAVVTPGEVSVSRGFRGSGRYQFWDAAIDAFGDHPVVGIGAGQYEWWWNQHGTIDWTVKDAHSLLFETLAELGIVGLALVLAAFLAIPIAGGWQRRAGPSGPEVGACLAVLAAGMLSAANDWMWELPAAFAGVVVAAALLCGPATDAAAATDAELAASGPLASRRNRVAAAIAVALAGWVAIWTAADLLFVRTRIDDSRSAVAAGHLSEAADDARDAVALQPWSAEPRLQLGLVLERQGELAAAEDALRAAARRAPDDWSIPYSLSRVQNEAGMSDEAAASLSEARRLNPRSPLFVGG